MNIEGLNKRKEVLEEQLNQLNKQIEQNTQNAFRVQGAIMDVNEIIQDDEKKLKEEKEKKEDKSDKKVK